MAPFFSWLFGGEPPRQPPAPVPTDTIIKLGVLENSLMMKSLYMNWTFRVDDALDINMLRTSLDELITTAPNWRKLGGRFRRNEDGTLELHIPSGFSDTRPAAQFTHEEYDISVREHPLDGTLPRTQDKPAITDSPEQLDDILAGPKAPRNLDDWLFTDTPALVVHVICFTDATFITLTYSHSLVDGVGKREIVTNWCKVLAGRMEDVAPLAGWDEEPMEEICRPLEAGEERQIHADKQLKGWRKWYWVFRFIYERLANRNNYRQRNLFIPASTMARIRQSVEKEKEDEEEKAAPGTPYLSDNQLLTTWLVRLACLPLKHTNRPLGISSAVDLRGFPQLGGVRPGTVYLQNLLAYTWINTSPADILRAPLARAAALMRAELKPQLTLPQVRAAACLTHGGIKRSGTVDFFIGKDTYTISVSSLAKAKYWETIDFGPAVVKAGPGNEKGLAGRLVWQSSTPRSRLKPSCLIVIQGKDLRGNWFAQMVLSQRTWDMVEKELAAW